MEPLRTILQTLDSITFGSLSAMFSRSASTHSTSQHHFAHSNPTSSLSDAWGLHTGASSTMLIRIAGLSGAAAVALAAYGSHIIKENKLIDEQRKRAFENGNKQHFIHTMGLMLSYKARLPALTAALFASGIVCFTVPCYAYGIWKNERYRHITPIGGVLFILGWLSFIL